MFEVKLGSVGRPERGETLAPFDEHEGGTVHELVEAEGEDFGDGVEAVEINVEDAGRVAVFVDEGEGGGVDFLFGGGATGSGDAFDEGGFASAEVADEQDGPGGGQEGGEVVAEGDGFVGGVGSEGEVRRAHEGPPGGGG